MSAQTLRQERVARAIHREVAPVWHDRFARLILRHLPAIDAGLVLDVHCGPGHLTRELLDRLPTDTKVVALEPDEALRAIAKGSVDAAMRGRVYFKAGDFGEISTMGDDTYDLVAANLVLAEAHNPHEALAELVRVTKPGGYVLATLPMHGTWTEVEDLLREVLAGGGHDDAVRRLRRLRRLRPAGQKLADSLARIGVADDHFVIQQERFDLLFPSGREFLFAPAIEHGPLRLWKAIIGNDGNPQELFWRLKESIDAYCGGRGLNVSAVAGLLRLRVPSRSEGQAEASQPPAPDQTLAGDYWGRFPELNALWSTESLSLGDDFDLDLEVDVDLEFEEDNPTAEGSTPAGPQPAAAQAPPGDGSSASSSMLEMPAEDREIFAALEQTSASAPEESRDLERLLDQVLEFAEEQKSQRIAEFEELDFADIEEIDLEPKRKPGDTLSRIRSLLPPPPSDSRPGAPPPPPPTRKPTRKPDSD